MRARSASASHGLPHHQTKKAPPRRQLAADSDRRSHGAEFDYGAWVRRAEPQQCFAAPRRPKHLAHSIRHPHPPTSRHPHPYTRSSRPASSIAPAAPCSQRPSGSSASTCVAVRAIQLTSCAEVTSAWSRGSDDDNQRATRDSCAGFWNATGSSRAAAARLAARIAPRPRAGVRRPRVRARAA